MFIEFIDVRVAVPDDTLVEPKRARTGGATFYRVAGRSVEVLRDRLEVEAILRGFALRRSEAGTHLSRRGQSIDLITTGPTHAVIRVDDPDRLPDARVDADRIVLGPISLSLGPSLGVERIVPGKERHEEGTVSWEGEWRLFGERSAAALCSAIHRQLDALSALSSGLLAPSEGGPRRWAVEASFVRYLVRLYVLELADALRLDLFVVERVSSGRVASVV